MFFFWISYEETGSQGPSHHFNVSANPVTTTTEETVPMSTIEPVSILGPSATPSPSTTGMSTTTTSVQSSESSTSMTSSTDVGVASASTSAAPAVPNSNDTAMKIGLGVGLGVGIPLVLIAAGFLFYSIFRDRRRQRDQAAQPNVGTSPGQTFPPMSYASPQLPPTGQFYAHEVHGDMDGYRELQSPLPKPPENPPVVSAELAGDNSR